mmetsp:Transcript_8994/g.15744  ORF Transcript_8994/g.15744 Transcript_8994/m.15744 type:complete len:387 (+) Transcript_8994:491-1651(+)
MTQARPSAIIRSAILRSCSVTPVITSITSSTQSLRRIDLNARLIMKNSVPYSMLFLRRTPAVSSNRYSTPSRSSTSSTVSRVVPAISDTMARSVPNSLFRMEDLPTLGLPTIATATSSSHSAGLKSTNLPSISFLFCISSLRSSRIWSMVTTGKLCTTLSNKSPVPEPCNAEIAIGSPNPNFQNSAANDMPNSDSHLFTAMKIGMFLASFLKNDAICSSSGFSPPMPSTTIMAALASPKASRACCRIWVINNCSGSSSKINPPVSTNWNSYSFQNAGRYVLSLVIPTTSSTMAPALKSPAIRFTSCDLPTFGLPITATTGSLVRRFCLRRDICLWSAWMSIGSSSESSGRRISSKMSSSSSTMSKNSFADDADALYFASCSSSSRS